jgi:hypothetical protein
VPCFASKAARLQQFAPVREQRATVHRELRQPLERQLVDHQAADVLAQLRFRPAANAHAVVAEPEGGLRDIVADLIAVDGNTEHMALDHCH